MLELLEGKHVFMGCSGENLVQKRYMLLMQNRELSFTHKYV